MKITKSIRSVYGSVIRGLFFCCVAVFFWLLSGAAYSGGCALIGALTPFGTACEIADSSAQIAKDVKGKTDQRYVTVKINNKTGKNIAVGFNAHGNWTTDIIANNSTLTKTGLNLPYASGGFYYNAWRLTVYTGTQNNTGENKIGEYTIGYQCDMPADRSLKCGGGQKGIVVNNDSTLTTKAYSGIQPDNSLEITITTE